MLRTLTRAALCAAACLALVAPITAASAAPATEGGTSDMCYPLPKDNICTWQGTTALETKTAGSFTRIEAVAVGSYFYLKIIGKADCITWNASKVYFYQLACGAKTYQEFSWGIGPANYYTFVLRYTGTGECLTGDGNGENIVMAGCNGLASQNWFWPVST